MKSAAFEYIRPASLAEAVDCIAGLTAAGKDAQVLAGGQSLLAMMNLRVSVPEVLIDISRIEQLKVVQEGPNAVRVGACVTHAAIEDGRVRDPSRGLMKRVAESIAYRAVRTRGTIGGSLALSDPAGDWVTVMQALGAQVALVGPKGRREIDALEFTIGIYETVREKDELIESISIPKLSDTARFGFSKFCRKTGEFAHSIAVAIFDPSRSVARIVLGGSGATPSLLKDASTSLSAGSDLEEIERAAERDLAERDDTHDEFQRSVHGAMIARAVSQVLAWPKSASM